MTSATATTSPTTTTTESSSSAQLPSAGFLFGESSFATDLNDLDPQQQPSPQSPRGTGNNNKNNNNNNHASFQSSSSKSLLQRLSFSSASGSSQSSDTSFVSAVSTESAAAALASSLPAVTTPTFSSASVAPPPGASLSMTTSTYNAHAVMSTPISNSALHASSFSAAALPISNAAFPHAGSSSTSSTSLPPFMGRGRRVGVAMAASKGSSLKHPPHTPVVSEALGPPETEDRATVVVMMEESTHCRSYASAPASSLAARDCNATSRVFTKLSRSSSSSSSLNLVQWLEHECPSDVVPKVLAFMGPQSFAALSRTNRHWKGLLQLESTWKVLCEELYKVSKVRCWFHFRVHWNGTGKCQIKF